MKFPGAILFAAMIALAGCNAFGDEDASAPPPSPLLYEVRDEGGQTQGWLFGTIHAMPDGTKWRTGRLNDVIDQADLLFVEIASLEDNTALGRIFASLATSPNQPEIGQRVSPKDRPALFELISRADYRASDFANVETWAAALMLAQATSAGDPRNGADRALIADFAGRPIRELEGAEKQLGIFDRLPQTDQSDLLEGVIEEATGRADDPTRLQRAWLYGDEAEIANATVRGILADPELHQALLVERNRDWAEQLATQFAGKEKLLVAVGTAHMVGDNGLVSLLRQQGFEVERVQ